MTTIRSKYIYKNKGFTLVEIVMVLLVLGILSSIAIPKFIDLKRDSQRAVLKGIVGTLRSTTAIYQPLAAIKGVENGSLRIDGVNVQFRSGYPYGHWNSTFRHILGISTKSSFTNANDRCSGNSLCGVGLRTSIPTVAGTTGGRGIIIWPEGYRINERCFSYYYNRNDGTYPLIGFVDQGC